MEDKHQRFIRLAEKRTNRVLESLRILGNCANRGVYEYEDGEIDRIFREIDAQVRATKALYKASATRQFRLTE
jgi:hypothetical protein